MVLAHHVVMLVQPDQLKASKYMTGKYARHACLAYLLDRFQVYLGVISSFGKEIQLTTTSTLTLAQHA